MSSTTVPKKYVINLDLPPEDRWTEVITAYKPQILQIADTAEEILGSTMMAIATPIMSALTNAGGVLYYQEIKGIAQQLDLPVGKVALMQLSYEIFSYCTSIVVEKDGVPLHFRSMDWDMKELAPMTIDLEFVRRGQTMFVGTGWPGLVGIMTGMKPGAFSVSINYRRTGDGMMTNFTSAVKSHWPVSFLIRHVLTSTHKYRDARTMCKVAKLIAPTYITLVGVNSGQACVLTRGRTDCDEIKCRDGKQSHVVQTNIDWWRNERGCWQDIEFSVDRREYAYERLEEDEFGINELWKLMDEKPVLAFDTLYQTGMCANTGYYQTKIVI